MFKKYPSYITQSKNYVNYCIQSINMSYPNFSNDQKKVLVNILRSKHKLSDYKKHEILENKQLQPEIVRITNVKFKIFVFFKLLIHKLFFILNKKRNDKVVVLRCWVEDCLQLFKSEIDKNTLFLVFPFTLSFLRQFRFLKYLIKNNHDFSFCGYDYSFKEYFTWVISSKDLDLAIFEINASKRLATTLLKKYKFQRLFTTDEFEENAFVWHQKLINEGRITINKAHGSGCYSPFINYTKFYAIHQNQIDYYSLNNKSITYKLMDLKENSFDEDLKIKNIIFFSQLTSKKCDFLIESENQVLNVLKELKKVQIFIKLHPNARRYKKEYLNNFSYITDLPKDIENTLNLSLYSTTYYTFQDIGPSYFIETSKNKPKLMYGSKIRVIKLENLLSFINEKYLF